MYWRAEPTSLRGTFRSCKFTSETEQRFDRTSSNGFKLPEGWFKLDIRKKLFTMRLVKHRHVAQRDGGCPIPGNIQDHTGQSSKQSHVVEDVPAHCMGMVLNYLLSNPNTFISLWFLHTFRDTEITLSQAQIFTKKSKPNQNKLLVQNTELFLNFWFLDRPGFCHNRY